MTTSNFNLDTLRAQQVKGFVQFQDPSNSAQYWRLKDRQSMTIGYNFGRVDHYQDDGTKARDWAGYNITFSMKLKITSDMFDNVWPPTDKKTISYWIYQNLPDPANSHTPTTFTMTFAATQVALSGPSGDPTDNYINHVFILDPNSFGDIEWNTTEGTYEITIGGEIISVAQIQRQSGPISP